MKKKNVPKKNYIYAVLLIIIVAVATLYCSSWYKTINTYYKNNSIISDSVSKIEINSLQSFLQDNPETVIYLSSSKDENVKEYEKKFKKIIDDNNLNNSIYYLDIDNNENINITDELLYNYLGNNLSKVKKLYAPNILFFEEGKIVDALYFTDKEINKEDTLKFLERIGLLENE